MTVHTSNWRLRLRLHLRILTNQKGADSCMLLIGQEMQTQTQSPIASVMRALGCFPFRRHKSTQVNTLKHSLPQLNGTRYTKCVGTFSYLTLQDLS